jgi:hypothetical protein
MPGRVCGGSWCDNGRNCGLGIFIPDPANACESAGFRVAQVPTDERKGTSQAPTPVNSLQRQASKNRSRGGTQTLRSGN